MANQFSRRKKVCVIGAGPSGLVATKELLAQEIEVKCFESQGGIGGAFRHTSEGGRSYDSIELTVSNYFMAYSDFMPPGGEPRRYWKVEEYRDYLHQYARKFKLFDHIYLSHEVVDVDVKDRQLFVRIANDKSEYVERFDHLLICSGSNFVPYYPDYLSSGVFKGEVVHSFDYINAEAFKGKKVLCIGLGESGADTVHEISQVTDCEVLVRDKPNVVPRWIHNYTNDAFTSYCFYEMGRMGIDWFMKFKAWFYLHFDKTISKEERLVQEWIAERDSFMSKFFTKNDIFINDLVKEKFVLTQGEVQEVLPDGVLTDKGKHIKADVLFCNTGYQTCFKKFAFGKAFSDSRKLFKQMISPEYGDLISIIGWARPTQGGLPACSEMQARYIALLIKGQRSIPEKEVMKKIIARDEKYAEYYFSVSKHIKSLVNYHDFMPDMARLVGCKPSLLCLHMPGLFLKLYFGSHLPAFYRLNDPDCEVRKRAFDVIYALPIAYSFRRIIVILLFTLFFRPLESIYLRAKLLR